MHNAGALTIDHSVTGKLWKFREYDDMQVLHLSQKLGIPDICARLLNIRGINVNLAEQFINPALKNTMPDPAHLLDMDKAVGRIIQAVNLQQPIAVFGDYDVDGATSSALLHRYFTKLGINPLIYIPDRIDEGYGPNAPAFDELKARGCQLIITVDCGTTSFAAIEHANNIGVDVIVLDHHVGEPELPNAYAIVNPNRLDETSLLRDLAAVGVTFMMLVALNRQLRAEGYFQRHNVSEPDLMSFLDLVALGTVCDVMPLTGLNRAFVVQGLKILSRRSNPGIKALCDVAGVSEKLSAYHLGFIIGPRINAGGRVGEAGLGSALLRSDNPSQCQEFAMRLHHHNEQRKVIEEQVLNEAIEQSREQEKSVVITYGTDWHPGVIGIIASRIKERCHRPAITISFGPDNVGKGSGRSIPGFDLGSAIHAAKQMGLLVAGGGHTMAAGFTIMRDQLSAFHDFMCQRLNSQQLDLKPTITIDTLISGRAVNMELIEQINTLQPFGVGNPSPSFAIANLQIKFAEIVGSDHVRCNLTSQDGITIKAIAFRCVQTPLGQALLNNYNKFVHVVGSIKENNWNGNENVQLIIEDLCLVN